MSFQPDQKFGRFKIVKRVGVGGMATVFHAVDTDSNKDVALKILHEQWAFDGNIVKRFELEASIGSRLNHPGIVPILDYGVIDSRPYIALKYMARGNLAHQFEKPRPVKLEISGKLLTIIGQALDYAHDNGVIHRDLKLENILLDEKRLPAVGDFGIAKIIGSTRMTMTGQFMGTPHYMAPEQIDTDSDLQGKSVDLYAFAVMAYLMATGYFPFTASDPFQLVVKHKHQRPPVPTTVNPNLPAKINEVLLRGLQKKPMDRFFSAGEFAEAFNAALRGKGQHTTLIFINKENPVKVSATDTVNLSAPTPVFNTVESLAELPETHDATVSIPAVPITMGNEPEPKKSRRWLPLLLLLIIFGGTAIATIQFREPLASAYLAMVNPQETPTEDTTPTEISDEELTATAQSLTTADATEVKSITPTDETASNSESTATITRTPRPTNTVRVSATSTSRPTNTTQPTNTATTRPTNTSIPPTNTPRPTNTSVPPTNTPRPANTAIPIVPTAVPIIETAIPSIPDNPVTGGGNDGGSSGGGSGGGIEIPGL